MNTVYRLLTYILWAAETLLGLRFVFRLFGANPSNGFVNFLYDVTYPMVAPFFGIFGTPVEDGLVFEIGTLIAMVVYALLFYAVIYLLGIFAEPRHAHAAEEEHYERHH